MPSECKDWRVTIADLALAALHVEEHTVAEHFVTVRRSVLRCPPSIRARLRAYA